MKAKLTRLLMIAGILLLMFGLYSTHKQARAASPIKLTNSLIRWGGFNDYRISPDSSRVVYRVDHDTEDVYELYSVPLDDSPQIIHPAPGTYFIKISYSGLHNQYEPYELSGDLARWSCGPRDNESGTIFEI
ncbi:MAG: hypothetical protein MRK01_07720 [Candidatus Scalindua sp.]|nr:hypothetical protein [Candidatus Scalindua sp.]